MVLKQMQKLLDIQYKSKSTRYLKFYFNNYKITQ